MNLIEHLNRTVTPAILTDNATTDIKELLTQFYAIFCARLADDNVYQKLKKTNAKSDGKIFQQMWEDNTQTETLVEELANAHHLDQKEVKILLIACTPLLYQEVHALAGDTPLPTFLHSHLENYRDHVPIWSLALLSTTTSQNTEVNTTNTSLTDTTSPPTNNEFLKSLKPVVGLVLFSAVSWILIRGCENNPEPIAKPNIAVEQNTAQQAPLGTAPTDTDHTNSSDNNGEYNNNSDNITDTQNHKDSQNSENEGIEKTQETTKTDINETEVTDTAILKDTSQIVKQPATLSLTLDKSGKQLYACQIKTADQASQNQMLDTVQKIFNSPKVNCQREIDEDIDTQIAINKQLTDTLKQLVGINSASIRIDGYHIQVNAPDKNKRTQLIEKLQKHLPDFEIVAEPELDIHTIVEYSIQSAEKALEEVNQDNNQPNIIKLTKALNQQIINFAVDSADIPQENKRILDRSAELLSQMPNTSLSIIGFTDSSGSSRYNLKLSQERADAVKKYLISRGVNKNKIITKGLGEKQPVADNETEQGRFRNRRIEFRINKEGEAISNINADSAKP